MPTAVVLILVGLTLLIVFLVIIRPEITAARGGKILAFLALFVFPVFAGVMGFENHMERSKQTAFCLSCHVMEPYGKYYIGHPANPIKLYEPINNRECLHCHLGARSFEQGAVHNADPQTMADIKSNKLSCMSSGCHDTVHNVSQLDHVKYWKPQP